MAKFPVLTPSHKAIRAYYDALRGLAAQDVEHEQAVRSAFANLLAELGKPLKWTAVPELGRKVEGKRVVPDGTMRDKYQLPRGYWEAKDTADKLDVEIEAKKGKGYPLNNTIFWTPVRAVLFQNGQRKLDVEIDERNGRPAALGDLLTTFFTYVDKPLVDFDEAVEQFTERVPEVGKKLASIIADAHQSHRKFKEAFGRFFELCKTTLNPNITQQAVDEMLVQHLLTARLFKSVFSNPEFLRNNVIAVEVEKVIDALASRSFSREEFLSALDRFYVAIENAASRAGDWSSKQHFLNTVYERFFQGYCVKTADTHGIVYTPQPIVNFMCASVEWVLETEFGKKLGDDGVNLLDPCTGTANFVVNLMRRVADRGKKQLRRMYSRHLFANEIMLMPYYIAALNIEHEFFEQTGEYEPFEGLCFVDTLDLAESRQMGMFTEANLARVERQKNTPITVVIGNPPYNSRQQDENDNNKNRAYPVIDTRVRLTYAADSIATSKIALQDPYVKFFRWATDRIRDSGGIVAFVSNNGFLELMAFDGMRRHLARDFDAFWHFDLQGNVRKFPKLSGSAYNVFGIQVGVGITIGVRGISPRKGVFYRSLPEDDPRFKKLATLDALKSIRGVRWTKITPDAKHDWFPPAGDNAFRTLLPVGTKETKAQRSAVRGALFKSFTNGIKTNRDSTVYSFDEQSLATRIRHLCDELASERARYSRWKAGRSSSPFQFANSINWSLGLKNRFAQSAQVEFEVASIRESLYRPFSRRRLYFDRTLNEAVYLWDRVQPNAASKNRWIIVGAYGRKAFSIFAGSQISDVNFFVDPAQCFPYWTFNADGSRHHENITDWSLSLFRRHFAKVSRSSAAKAKKISKWDIFHYVYGILHHPGYRETFAENLKRELPRIPLAKSYDDFRAFVTAGEKLAELHLHYDDEKAVKPYKLKENWKLADSDGRPLRKSWRVQDKMRLSKDKETLRVNDTLTLEGIPGDVCRYRLGNRSGLEWVIDQYQVTTDKRTGIVSDCNAWGEERDDPEYIARLVKQVVTVSLETLKIIDGLPKDFGGPAAVAMEAAAEVADGGVARRSVIANAPGTFALSGETISDQKRMFD